MAGRVAVLFGWLTDKVPGRGDHSGDAPQNTDCRYSTCQSSPGSRKKTPLLVWPSFGPQ